MQLHEKPILTEDQVIMLKSAFNLFSPDKSSGKIKISDIKASLESLGHNRKKTLYQIITYYEKNDITEINFDQFTSIMSNKLNEFITEDDLKKGFYIFDYEDKNYLTAKDLKRLSKEFGENMSMDDLNNIIKLSGSEDRVNFEEFWNTLTSNIKANN